VPPACTGLVTITSVLISTNATLVIRMLHRPIAEATQQLSVQTRDTRIGINVRPTAQLRTDSNVAILGGDGEFRIGANSPLLLSDPNGISVLAPGTGLTFSSSSVASQLTVTFYWRERVAEASELLF